MTERRAPTPTMKLESLYALGQIRCAVCAERLTEAETQWDHVHALVLDGPDVGTNLRPLHIACHARITARLARDLGHIRRLTGETQKRRSRPLKGGGFRTDLRRRMNGAVERVSQKES